MRNKIIIIILIFLCSNSLLGQNEIIQIDTTGGRDVIVIKIKGETALDKVLPVRFMYAFDEFRDAKVILNNGSAVNTKININLVSGEVLFIDRTGRIMQIGNQEEIKMILESGNIWMPAENTFGKQIYDKDGVNVLCVTKTETSNYQIETAFGGKSNTSSAQSITSVTSGNIAHTIIPVGEFTFTLNRQYYITMGKNKYFANSRALRKLFPGKKKEINAFIKSNNSNLQKEEDLLRILDFIMLSE